VLYVGWIAWLMVGSAGSKAAHSINCSCWEPGAYYQLQSVLGVVRNTQGYRFDERGQVVIAVGAELSADLPPPGG